MTSQENTEKEGERRTNRRRTKDKAGPKRAGHSGWKAFPLQASEKRKPRYGPRESLLKEGEKTWKRRPKTIEAGKETNNRGDYAIPTSTN